MKEHGIDSMKYRKSTHIAGVIQWVSFNDEYPKEGEHIIIFEKDYGAWSCDFEFDESADYSKSVWCLQPIV